jgi:thioredoxin
MAIITCPNCGAKNNVDDNRAAHEIAKCGKCGTPLPAADAHPMTITDDSFARDVLQVTGQPVLVDTWAVWCPPCRAIAPIIDQLAAESAGKYRVGKLNVDENPRTAQQYHIDSIPTLLIFKDGKLVDKLVGAHPKPTMVAALQKWM